MRRRMDTAFRKSISVIHATNNHQDEYDGLSKTDESYNNNNNNNTMRMYTSKLTTASGKPICRYALGGAARSTQPESLPLHYRDYLSELELGAPFYFYYNPHRYPNFLSGVAKSFSADLYDRRNVFIASGSSDRTPAALDQRLEDALVYSGGDYLDAFVLEYVCPEELTVAVATTATTICIPPDNSQNILGPELEAAIQHVRSYVALEKVRYIIASTHSHVVGAVLASASLPRVMSNTTTSNENSSSRSSSSSSSAIVDALMLRYNLSHKRAAETLSLPNALGNEIPVIAFTTTRWNRLQSHNDDDDNDEYCDEDALDNGVQKKINTASPTTTTSDCLKFALRHPAVEIVLHSARDEEELAEALLPLIATTANCAASTLSSMPGSKESLGWLSEEENHRLRLYGNDELHWNDDGFDEYPEEGCLA